MDTNDSNKTNYELSQVNSKKCQNLIALYEECLKLNIEVFGKERGPLMCGFLMIEINKRNCDYKQ